MLLVHRWSAIVQYPIITAKQLLERLKKNYSDIFHANPLINCYINISTGSQEPNDLKSGFYFVDLAGPCFV